MLTEYKNKHHHYYQDERGRIQGEFKWWLMNGRLSEHSLYKDDKRHGEYKEWWDNGQLESHHFYQNHKDITKEVKELVEDFNNITKEERMIIKLKFGIECLC